MPIPIALAMGMGAVSGGISGMVSAADSRAGRSWQQFENQKAREYNTAEAQKARDFSEHQRTTAYQTSMADMKAAGLNPMLAMNQGGASSTSAAQASSQQTAGTPNEDRGQIIQRAMESALQIASIEADVKKKDADTALAQAETAVAEKQKEIAGVTAKAAKANLPKIESEAKLGKEQAEWDRSAITYDNIAGRASELVNTAAGSIGRFLRGGLTKTPPTNPGGAPRDSKGRTRAEVERDSYKRQLKTYRKGKQ